MFPIFNLSTLGIYSFITYCPFILLVYYNCSLHYQFIFKKSMVEILSDLRTLRSGPYVKDLLVMYLLLFERAFLFKEAFKGFLHTAKEHHINCFSIALLEI